MIRQRHKVLDDIQAALSGSTLLALSLFIILLAFFIVLNAISHFAQPKVDAAFDSLDLTFAANILPNPAQEEIMAENQPDEGGEGDSLEDMQDILRSILPGLNVQLNDNPTAGQTMAIRIQKEQFEKLSKQLIPLIVRIMNIKDNDQEFYVKVTSYVRNPLSEDARKSINIIDFYKDEMAQRGITGPRIKLAIERGNPAFLSFEFRKGRGL